MRLALCRIAKSVLIAICRVFAWLILLTTCITTSELCECLDIRKGKYYLKLMVPFSSLSSLKDLSLD